MSLPGSNDRFDERSYAPYQADMPSGYAGEVPYASGSGAGPDTVHHRQQGEVAGDILEDGAEDRRLVEDGARQVQDAGGEHLHEAGMTMTQLLYYSGLALAGVTLAYFALDIVVWALYYATNLF